MAVSYLAFYQITTADSHAFLEFYKTKHAPLLLKFPGLLKLVIHEKIGWTDSKEDPDDAFLVIVEFVFPDTATMEAAISSEAREAARESFKNFPAFQGKVWHQAMGLHEMRISD